MTLFLTKELKTSTKNIRIYHILFGGYFPNTCDRITLSAVMKFRHSMHFMSEMSNVCRAPMETNRHNGKKKSRSYPWAIKETRET